MSAILRRLQGSGLIERSVDGLDRRFVVVSLTSIGREAARLVRDAADDLEERLVESCPSDDIRLGYAVADLIIRSRWVGPGRARIRMPDWS